MWWGPLNGVTWASPKRVWPPASYAACPEGYKSCNFELFTLYFKRFALYVLMEESRTNSVELCEVQDPSENCSVTQKHFKTPLYSLKIILILRFDDFLSLLNDLKIWIFLMKSIILQPKLLFSNIFSPCVCHSLVLERSKIH